MLTSLEKIKCTSLPLILFNSIFTVINIKKWKDVISLQKNFPGDKSTPVIIEKN